MAGDVISVGPGHREMIYSRRISTLKSCIIMRERCVTLMRLISPSSKRWTIQEFGSQQKFFEHVFNQCELPPFLGYTQLTQNTDFFFTRLYQRPADLAVCVMRAQSRKSFGYIMKCVVPAMFGYFSSKEHLQVACRFYCAIAENSPEKTLCCAINPLLFSSATFRFTEVAFTRFLRRVQIDAELRCNEATWMPSYVGILERSIIHAIQLVPAPVLDVMRSVSRRMSGREIIEKVFVRNFLAKSFLRWVRSISPGHEKIARVIFDRMIWQDSSVSMIMDALLNSVSVYDVPSCRVKPTERYIDLYICVHDMYIVTELVNEGGMMPDTVTATELVAKRPNSEWMSYPCHLRIDGGGDRSCDNVQLFDCGSREMDVADSCISCMMRTRELADWLAVIEDHEKMMIQPLIRAEAVAGMRLNTTFMMEYKRITDLFNVPGVGKMTYLTIMDVETDRWIVSDNDVLGELEVMFARIDATWFTDIGVISIPKRGCAALVDVTRRLASIGCVGWYERYATLLNVSRQLEIATQRSCVIDKLVRDCRGSMMLVTILVLGTFAMGNPLFIALAGVDDCQMWNKMETVFTKTMAIDPELTRKYGEVQDALAMKSVQIIR